MDYILKYNAWEEYLHVTRLEQSFVWCMCGMHWLIIEFLGNIDVVVCWLHIEKEKIKRGWNW